MAAVSEIRRVLSQRDATGLRRGASPAARNEQQMGCAIHELRARGTRLLKQIEFIGKGAIAQPTYGVPPGVRRKSTMKQVKTSQIFDIETAREMISQFDRGKQVKAECQASAVAEVDFAAVPDVILFQASDILDRIDKGCRSASNRTHRRYEMPRRNACDLGRYVLQTCNGKMAESAVQAKGQIDRGIGFRQPVCKIRDVERQIYPGKAGKISSGQSRPLYLPLCDVKSARRDVAEPERTST